MTAQAKVLIVDDDPTIEKILRPYLAGERFTALTAGNADEAAAVIERERPDVILLDLTMPGKSGLDLLHSLRGRTDTFVIVLTGRAHELDRIVGLELGADDYVTKPFSPREVISRIKAVLRRRAPERGPDADGEGRILAGDLCLNLRERLVSVSGTEVALTPTEFRILEVLASEPGRAFSRAELLDRVNADSLDVAERTLDSHVAHLRQKIEPGRARPQYVLTVFGFGYKFNRTPERVTT